MNETCEINFTPYLNEMKTMWDSDEFDQLNHYIKDYIKTLYLDDECFQWIQEHNLDKIKRYVYTFKLGNTSPKKVKSLFKKVTQLINITELYKLNTLVCGLPKSLEIDEMKRLYSEIMWLINKGVFLRITDNFQFRADPDIIMIRNEDTKYLQVLELHIHDWMDIVDKTIRHAKKSNPNNKFLIFFAIFVILYFTW